MLVGRELDCDLRLASIQISRYHAKLLSSANTLFIEDLKSSNGTFVNGHLIRNRMAIGIGDQIAFDDILFRVTSKRSSEEDITRLATAQNLKKCDVAEAVRTSEQVLSADKLAAEMPIDAVPAEIRPKQQKVHEMPDIDALINDQSVVHEDNTERSEPSSPPQCEAQLGTEREPQPSPDSDADHKREDRGEDDDEYRNEGVNEGITTGEEAEEGKTRYLSLNALDQYVHTNQRFQRDIDLGSGPRLVAMTAPIRGKVFSLECDDEVKCWSVGRDESSDICLPDKTVSREHAWLTKMEAVYELKVNDAVNLIVVNGENCLQADLRHNDRVQIGTLELVFKRDVKTPLNMSATGQKDGKIKIGEAPGLSKWLQLAPFIGIFVLLMLVFLLVWVL